MKIFDDIDDCIACINGLSNQKIILIVSDDFCDSFLPRIETIFHILSIYILSETPNKNFTFSSTSIRGVYQSIDDIYSMISDDINPIKSDLLTFQPVYTNSGTLDLSFVFFQLLDDILRDHTETENAFQELVYFAREEYQGNEHELSQIEEFEKRYKNTEAIFWFSRHCFLSKVKKFLFYRNRFDSIICLDVVPSDISQ